jgi:hypothetical protein
MFFFSFVQLTSQCVEILQLDHGHTGLFDDGIAAILWDSRSRATSLFAHAHSLDLCIKKKKA